MLFPVGTRVRLTCMVYFVYSREFQEGQEGTVAPPASYMHPGEVLVLFDHDPSPASIPAFKLKSIHTLTRFEVMDSLDNL